MHAGIINKPLRGGARLERAEECKRDSRLGQKRRKWERCFLDALPARTSHFIQQLFQAATWLKPLFHSFRTIPLTHLTQPAFPKIPPRFRGQLLIFAKLRRPSPRPSFRSLRNKRRPAEYLWAEVGEKGRREERRVALTGRLKGAQTENCGVDECRLEWRDK